MPTVYLYPIGAGNRTQLVPEPAAPNWGCVDEDPQTLLDWVGIETDGILSATDHYVLTIPPADPGDLSALTLTAEHLADKTANNGVAGIAASIRLGVTTVVEAAHAVAVGAATYTTALPSRPGGGSWAWADLAGLQLGQLLNASGGGVGTGLMTKVVCHRTRLKVDYTVAPAPPASKGIVETMFLSDGSTEGLAVGPGVESLPVSGGGVETIGVGPRIESLTVSDGNTEVV